MKYPVFSKNNVIDITKSPYNADNTGKIDCTKILQQAINDCLKGYIDSLNQLREELLALYKEQGGNVFVGAEAGRVIDGEVFMTLPKETPPIKIIYFPNGTYLVSDTICYTFDNLFAPQQKDYICELCRNIHILGETKEGTIIRLADNAKGFERGANKPVISFNRKSVEDKDTTNCAQLNTLEDITIDCGHGNEGAIGVLYVSSNCGRIENVCIKTAGGCYGLVFDYSTEGCFQDIEIVGFDYGIKTCHTSPCVFNEVDLSQNKIAGVLSKNGNLNFQKVNFGNIPALETKASGNGRYYFADQTAKVVGESEGNFIFYQNENRLVKDKVFPKNIRSKNFDDWVYIDDFGAVGDGKTDSTEAIQKAMNSGKSVILFGAGTYVINHTIKIPSSVQTLDFMYASIKVGYSLLIGEMSGVFDVCEDSETTFFAEHFAPGEHFSGFFRTFRHSSKRTMVIKDMSMSASLYFNKVQGGEVYFDNVFTHTNHYTQNVCLLRDGYEAVFCRMIPVELHGQKAYANNLNIERADVELLNDASELCINGYKVEGPGIIVKTINGGKTQLNLFNAAWWGNHVENNPMFDIQKSEVNVLGGNIFCYPNDKRYCLAFVIENEFNKQIYLDECSKDLIGNDALNRSWGRLIENISLK